MDAEQILDFSIDVRFLLIRDDIFVLCVRARGQVVKEMDGELIKVYTGEGKERASLRRKEKGRRRKEGKKHEADKK